MEPDPVVSLDELTVRYGPFVAVDRLNLALRRGDGRPFAFAGLWERWQGGDGAVESCAILTTAANAVVRPVHERMPVILAPEDFATWLDTSWPPAELQALLRPFPAEEMQARAVGRWVNDPRHEGPQCLAPAG